MINFIRKLRFGLVGTGNVRKYFTYALGEIALVMIGILLALQINNWNEKRKINALEQEYYCLLLDELKQDKQQVLKLKELVKERVEASNKAIAIIQKDKSDATELGIQYRLALRAGKATFRPADATYQDIKSSGKLSIMRDKDITKQLNTYFKNVDGYTSTIMANFELDFNNISHFDNWFEIGYFNSIGYINHDIFTDEIRQQLQEDIPKYIREDIKPQLYSALITVGMNNRRRSELLDFIEEEIEVTKSKLANKCSNNG
jgi:hypothetical protein